MTKQSAGILAYREEATGLRVLLAHPGGPFWARRDLGSWSIPKGEYGEGEPPEDAARREFEEETGARVSSPLIPLGQARQPGGKIVLAFGCNLEFDVSALRSNSFEMIWPPKSGRLQTFPEVDRAAWFAPDEARKHILSGQAVFLDRLNQELATTRG